MGEWRGGANDRPRRRSCWRRYRYDANGSSSSVFESKAFSLLSVGSPQAATIAEEDVADEDEDDGVSGDGGGEATTIDGRSSPPRRTGTSNSVYEDDKIFDLLGGAEAVVVPSANDDKIFDLLGGRESIATGTSTADVDAAANHENVFDFPGGGGGGGNTAANATTAVAPTDKENKIVLQEVCEGELAAASATGTADVFFAQQLVKDGRSVSKSDGFGDGKPGSISETTTAYKDVEMSSAFDEPSSTSSTCVVRTISKEELLPMPQSPPPSEESGEIEELRRLIRIEQQLIEEEQQRIAQGTNQLRSIIQHVQFIENETLEVEKALDAERANLFRSELRLEANRIQLLRRLRLIFPIRVMPINTPLNPPNFPRHQFTIANLPFPCDIHTPIVSDDQVSAALGLVCHMVSLTSKYLGIPLRYALICKFSRSAVLFLGGEGNNNGNKTTTTTSRTVYPLFRERGVIDREQLDYGLTLLDRNVNCLLRIRNVGFRNEWNLLAKIDRLFAHVIDGE
ncbi:hypothetical protein ACHAW5_007797 [Stephanodiscus triporus]|uniref:Uncharacterized protein n=1 Tax=Stephanodiscus triporus TaxID=2934178 RepID=A0ABD3PT23_9STRA